MVVQNSLKDDTQRWQKKKGMGIYISDNDHDCITNLMFADDVLLFASSKDQLQKNVVRIQKNYWKCETKILSNQSSQSSDTKKKKEMEVDDIKKSKYWQEEKAWDTLARRLRSCNRRRQKSRIESGLPGCGCTQEHLTRHFSHVHYTRSVMYNHTTWLKKSQCSRMCPSSAHLCHLHAIHDERLSVCSSLLLCFSLCLFPCVSPSPCSSLQTSTCTLSWTSSSMWTTPRQTYLASPPIEESCFLAEITPPTVEDTRPAGRKTRVVDSTMCDRVHEVKWDCCLHEPCGVPNPLAMTAGGGSGLLGQVWRKTGRRDGETLVPSLQSSRSSVQWWLTWLLVLGSSRANSEKRARINIRT